MKKIWKWILYGLGVLVLAFLIALPLFTLGGLGRFARVGVMRGGYGLMPMHMFGGFGMFGLLGWILPAILIALFVILLIALFGGFSRRPAQTTPPVPAATCPKCGKPVETGWVACPYCGKKL